MVRYAITDRMLLGEDEAAQRRALIEQAARLARAGVDYLQLREKDLGAGELVELARAMMRAIGRSGRLRLLVNGRVDVAIAAGADGVHLTSAEGELTAAQVREVYAAAGMGRALGSVSCHAVVDVEQVCGAGERPDVILFGPVFEKRVRGEVVAEGNGVELLREACVAAGETRVLALGGVTEANAAVVMRAGAAGVAGIRLFAAGDEGNRGR